MISNTTIKNFLTQNSEFLLGARIQKIQQPSRKEFIFVLRNNGEVRKLYININAELFHICFMSKERLIEIPQKPPMFCMLLRKYLENSKIAKINQPEFERIIEFYIETYNELSEKIYLCLSIELMGKHSNVILYNYDTNIIIGSAHNIGIDKSRYREIRGGLPYIYPPKQEAKWFEDNIDNIDEYYGNLMEKEQFKQLKSKYQTVINKKLKKIQTQKCNTKKQVNPDKFRLYGDLIMANLHNYSEFEKSINVFDYENNSEIEIKLDETQTLKDNANLFYKQYSKAKKSNEKYLEMSKKLNEELEYYEQILYSIENAQNIDDLLQVSFEIEPNKPQIKTKPVIEEIKENNYTIWIGKNNKQNDYIVSKLAKDNDLWFHIHNCAGSHVLLRANEITDELIFKCAKLAKQYSRASQSSKVGIIYTKAKYLKKPPNANLGYVTYSHESEIVVD